MRFRRLLFPVLVVGAGLLAGCEGGDSLPREPDLYPVTGRVAVQGEPLAGAVVTFLQVDEKGTLAVGETDQGGNYILTHLARPGVAAARYKVSVSYLVGTDGTVYGLGPRSGLAKPYGMLTAKELLPPEWSDLGVVTRIIEVPEGGGVFDLDIDQPLLPPPEPPDTDPGAEGEPQAPPPIVNPGDVVPPPDDDLSTRPQVGRNHPTPGRS